MGLFHLQLHPYSFKSPQFSTRCLLIRCVFIRGGKCRRRWSIQGRGGQSHEERRSEVSETGFRHGAPEDR